MRGGIGAQLLHVLRTLRTTAAAIALVLAGPCVGAVAGCGSDTVELAVDLKTDLRPGSELASVRTELSAAAFDGGTMATIRQAMRDVTTSSNFVHGERIAEYPDVPKGAAFVRVTLLDARGVALASRTTHVTLSDDYVLTVLVTRDCRAVVCPVPGGDPSLVACVGARCVSPECTPDRPDLCGDRECTEDLDCASAVACVRSRCVDGECFEVPEDALCASGERCDGAEGCLVDTTPDAGPPDSGVFDAGRDAGPAPMDAGLHDGGGPETACTNGTDDDLDGNADCADSDCAGSTCDDGNACTHTDVCAAGACAGTAITCASATCVTRACNGSATCTVTNAGTGTSCASDSNACTRDHCDGAGACAHDRLANGAVCGASYERCCSGRCTNLRTSDGNCGGCGISCSGRGCGVMPGTTYPGCRCVSNSQCESSLGTGATCWNRGTDATWYCNCQANNDCAASQTCSIVTGHNYCHY